MVCNRNFRLSRKTCVFAVVSLLFINVSIASDTQSLADKVDVAREKSRELEQKQLQKAKDAAGETAVREKKIYKKMQENDWEMEQRDKAKKQFNERESREAKYLREARESASKERKIPKPI
ncbi:MAG: hypothetical protein V5788_07110 [Shewanella sp.]